MVAALVGADIYVAATMEGAPTGAGLLGEVVVLGGVHLCITAAGMTGLWALASLLRPDRESAATRDRLVHALALAAVVVVADRLAYGGILYVQRAFFKLRLIHAACVACGLVLYAARFGSVVRAQWLPRLVISVATLGVVATIASFGTTALPVFAKIHRGPIAAQVLALVLDVWLVLAVWGPRVSVRRNLSIAGLAALACMGLSIAAARLPERGTHYVAQTLEGVRALRVLNRSVAKALGLTSTRVEQSSPSTSDERCVYRFPLGAPRDCPHSGDEVRCTRLSQTQPDSVVLLSIDSLRADYFGVPLRQLPNFERLARESLSFRRAMQTSSGTHMSLFGLHTGRYASAASPAADAWPSWSRALGADYVSLLQGWQETITESATQFTDRLVTTLGAKSRGGRPFLLHAHYMSLHVPGGNVGRHHDYAGVVRALDAELGRVRAELERLGLAARTIVVVTGDHGEEYRRVRGYAGHGFGMWDSSVLTPLMIQIPGSKPRSISQRVSAVDLFPTLLEATGTSCALPQHGRSLLQGPGAERAMYGSSYAPNPAATSLLFSSIHAVVEGPYKLVYDAWEDVLALYDLRNDSAERHNLVDIEPSRVRALLPKLASYMAGKPSP